MFVYLFVLKGIGSLEWNVLFSKKVKLNKVPRSQACLPRQAIIPLPTATGQPGPMSFSSSLIIPLLGKTGSMPGIMDGGRNPETSHTDP